jgi:integrase
LRDGPHRRAILDRLVRDVGDLAAREFAAGVFLRWRSDRLGRAAPATLNNALAYLRAMFSELERAGTWTTGNPLRGVRQIPAPAAELAYLTPDQIHHLLAELDEGRSPAAGVVARICLSTGARWGEAETLRRAQVHPELIELARTKSGRPRALPISPDLYRRIQEGKEWDAIPPQERLFPSCYGAVRAGVDRAGIVLPAGQLSHVLRHTFASVFMQRGGNILVLQRALGHSSLTMTMRYSHFARTRT